MEIVGKGTGSDILTKLPSPPSHLDTDQKRQYRAIGKILITAGVLKSIHLLALETLAISRAIFIFSVLEVGKKNKEKYGNGYVQTYSTGATNITTELGLLRTARKEMLETLALFGMDPQSEKKLTKAITDPNQGDLFNEFNNKRHG